MTQGTLRRPNFCRDAVERCGCVFQVGDVGDTPIFYSVFDQSLIIP